jgi:hypothetical protein
VTTVVAASRPFGSVALLLRQFPPEMTQTHP